MAGQSSDGKNAFVFFSYDSTNESILSNIYKLQYELVNITNTDYGSKLTPVFTLSGTLVID